MSADPKPGKAANQTAEKVLVALYGEDLTGCPVSIEAVSAIIQEGINAESAGHRMLVDALIRALRQIQSVSTPPAKSEVKTMEEVTKLLGERADAINQITTKILEAWDKMAE